ncbi:MAG: hypothetical protein ACKV22_13520 [Bryobacteraceae bacterium]
MVCPECRKHFAVEDAAICPYCGLTIAAGVVKSSAIMISSREAEGFYRSMEEVPESVRSMLIETTCGPGARTIIIADRRLRPKSKPTLNQTRSLKRHCEIPRAATAVSGRFPLALGGWIGLVAVAAASLVILIVHLLD